MGLLLATACVSARGTTVPVPVPSRPVPELLAALGDPEPGVRAKAAWDLAGADAADPLVAGALTKALDDPERSVREAATWTVGNLRGRVEGLPEAGVPRLVSQTRPVYPAAAFQKKVEGVVEVRLLVGEEGRVVHAEVRRSVPGLDTAALACVRQWVFTPAQRNGRPAATVADVPVSFRIL